MIHGSGEMGEVGEVGKMGKMGEMNFTKVENFDRSFSPTFRIHDRFGVLKSSNSSNAHYEN